MPQRTNRRDLFRSCKTNDCPLCRAFFMPRRFLLHDRRWRHSNMIARFVVLFSCHTLLYQRKKKSRRFQSYDCPLCRAFFMPQQYSVASHRFIITYICNLVRFSLKSRSLNFRQSQKTPKSKPILILFCLYFH